MYDKPSLEILEVNYSCSPGGVDEFEVYSLDERDHSSPPIFSATTLAESVQFCYNLGKDFTVRTLAQWEEKELAYEASR
jgi:hypothetical protein